MENQLQNQAVKNNESEQLNSTAIGDASSPLTGKFSDTMNVTNETTLKNTIIKNVVADDGDKKQSGTEIGESEDTQLFESLHEKLDTFKSDFLALVDVLQSEEPQITDNIDKSSLSLLADYGNSSTDESTDSDSDSDESESSTDVDEISAKGNFRSITYPEDSDSSTSSSSSSSEDYGSYNSDSSSDKESIKIVSSTSNEKKAPIQRRNKNDDLRLSELPPIENLQISVPESKCVELGNVISIVEEQVVIAALPNMPPLDIDTVLFLNKGEETLGKIFDIFGPVNNPMYTVRFNNTEDILNRNIKVGAQIYCAPTTEHTSYVLVADLMKVRGSDASWKEDTEPPAHLLDYSDDEEERRMRAKRKNKQPNPNDSTEQSTSSQSVSDFEKRKNEHNLYLNNRFNNKNKAFNQNPIRPRGFDFSSKWVDHHNRGPQPPFRPRHWWGDGSPGPSRFINPVAPMYPISHHPYFGGSSVFQQPNPCQYSTAFPQPQSAPSNVTPPRPDFSFFCAPPQFHFQQSQMLPPPPPPPPPKQNNSSFSSEM